ncbi:hypothetical protein ABOM_005891 [Aspergillus bombycis]|uniref:Uncharacterized protein n=1 Tax=Aspergillus bombycis TaxID=109264 RepID=A0A1F8A0I7_9EURO|nr:hypothetical protein ABOM_005891 [Aspergillus bombycis]OGM45230.1 hypothetical protein ABOM_005891 [Aspergillus bombycis]
MKIQILLSLMTLGLALGEPIPKQALSQRQTDNTCPTKMSCSTFKSESFRLSQWANAISHNASQGKLDDELKKQIAELEAEGKKLEACR